MLTKSDLHAFIASRELCVLSTVSAEKGPEAALVNVAVTPDLELIFYTIETNRKCINLRRNPRLAAVIGWEGPQTLQYEGVADEPREFDLDACKTVYFEKFPDREGPSMWPGITYFRVRPAWMRFSDYGRPWRVEEFTFPLPRR